MSDQQIQTDASKKAERVNALSKQHSDELSKYTYFVLAVAGAAIAYALKALEGKQPSYSLIFIAISIVLWAISFGFGIRNLHSVRQHMSVNANCILNDFTSHQMLEALDPWERRAATASNRQFAFLIVGCLSYMAFHIVEILATLGLFSV